MWAGENLPAESAAADGIACARDPRVKDMVMQTRIRWINPFLESLATNQSLTHLSLGCNTIDERGAAALATIVQSPRLMRLRLWCIRFTPPAREIFVRALGASPALKSFDNSLSNADEPDTKSLLAALARIRTLTRVGVRTPNPEAHAAKAEFVAARPDVEFSRL